MKLIVGRKSELDWLMHDWHCIEFIDLSISRYRLQHAFNGDLIRGGGGGVLRFGLDRDVLPKATKPLPFCK